LWRGVRMSKPPQTRFQFRPNAAVRSVGKVVPQLNGSSPSAISVRLTV
jgi:hypothetical protein